MTRLCATWRQTPVVVPMTPGCQRAANKYRHSSSLQARYVHVQNLMNSLWDIHIFLCLVPKESPCILLQVNLDECNGLRGTHLVTQTFQPVWNSNGRAVPPDYSVESNTQPLHTRLISTVAASNLADTVLLQCGVNSNRRQHSPRFISLYNCRVNRYDGLALNSG